MKEQRFKIIELPKYQVLAMKTFDEDENDAIEIIFFYEETKITQILSFEKPDSLDAAFEKLNTESAALIVENSLAMFK